MRYSNTETLHKRCTASFVDPVFWNVKGTRVMLAHNVFFTLTDNSPEAKQRLVAACKQYLSGHPGTVFFAAGPRAEELAWSVSDCDFDVVLELVFADKAAHDAYQDSPRHQQFLDENAENWKNIRAFDAYVEPA